MRVEIFESFIMEKLLCSRLLRNLLSNIHYLLGKLICFHYQILANSVIFIGFLVLIMKPNLSLLDENWFSLIP